MFTCICKYKSYVLALHISVILLSQSDYVSFTHSHRHRHTHTHTHTHTDTHTHVYVYIYIIYIYAYSKFVLKSNL